MSRILFATDFSDSADNAFDYLKEMVTVYPMLPWYANFLNYRGHVFSN